MAHTAEKPASSGLSRAPYRVLLCDRRYCQATTPPTAPVITIEVRR